MMDLVAAGVQSIDTLAFPVQAQTGSADEAWLAATAKDLATLSAGLIRAKITLVPMLAAARARAFPDEAIKDPALAQLPDARRTSLTDMLTKLSPADVARAREAWTSEAAFIRRFVKAGGRVATGSGFELIGYPVPGIGVHREMAALVRAGLTPADAIRAATVNGAFLLGRDAGTAAISPGGDANFIIVQGDPLKDIADLEKIATVIRAGAALEVKDLQARARSVVAK